MIVIFCPQPTPRLHYALKLLFEHVLTVPFQVIEDQTDFERSTGFKINYSKKELTADLHWKPHPVIESDTVESFEVPVSMWNDIPTLFPCDEPGWPFDLFAATFYLASRYEEYLPFEEDRHGRFTAEQSLAAQHGFLQRPLINEWAQLFADTIRRSHPEIDIEQKAYSAEITFDIDVTWAYRQKGWWRTMGAFGLDVAKRRWSKFKERAQVVFGDKKDPYNTYDYIFNSLDEYNLPGKIFFLLGDYSQFDRNASHENEVFRELIRRVSKKFPLGIHPSYGSGTSEQRVKKEIKRLANITGRTIEDSRQHYLRVRMPGTYRRLINLGIQRDYTMGYAQQCGFRASLCTPFPFFDVQRNEITELVLYPFAYMDGTLRHYMGLNTAEAKRYAGQLVHSVRKVNGHFMCLWHNSSLTDSGEWEGWREVYEDTLRACAIDESD